MSGIIGRYNIRGSGLVKKITASGFDDNAITLAKMAGGTDGNIISYDASGDPVAVATGTDGQALTSAGAGAVCAMEAVSLGGKVGQIIYSQSVSPSAISTTSSTLSSMGVTVAITCVATSSRVYLRWSSGQSSSDSAQECMSEFYRDTTRLGAQGYGMWNIFRSTFSPASASWMDSPSSTSELTYSVYFKSADNTNPFYGVYSTSYYQLTAIEILA